MIINQKLVQKNVKIDMKRLLYKNLLDWKKNPNRKPLILNGARQVGKTWLLQNFGFQEYESVAYINCESATNINELFADFDTKRIIRALSAYTNVDIVPNDSLIILDEVQLVEDFVEVLLSLMQDRRLDVYVSGSNSKFLSKDVVTEFRGRGDEIHIYPLSFSEYYAVVGGDKRDAWKDYYTYGGLPQVVLMESEEKKVNYLTDLFEQCI